MKKRVDLRGFVRNVNYDPQVRAGRLKRCAFEDFDINRPDAAGIIEFDEETLLPFSKWLSPKPSRSYPSARIYRTYHMSKPITVIPVLRDEGSGSQNNDRITFTTLSRMNLLGVYVILAWYDGARKHDKYENRVRDHKLNAQWVSERVKEIKRYRLSAHHWNETHFRRDFESVYREAVASYQRIGKEVGVVMNSADNHLALLEQNLVDGRFDLDAFARYSSPRSARSAKGEAISLHELEHLSDGSKAYLELSNFLGGSYHLTADEVYWEDDRLVIQEAKNNSRGALPILNDIQDGLFKNILFMSIDRLHLGEQPIQFKTRLKLTGLLQGRLSLPVVDHATIVDFANRNELTPTETKHLEMLNTEAVTNPGLSVEIAGNE